jgi:hypothetical protein
MSRRPLLRLQFRAKVEAVTVIAGVVAVLAALGAVWYARRTVIEARALRREERFARMAEVVMGVADASRRVRESGPASELLIAELRLKAAIQSSGEILPRCAALSTLSVNPYDVDRLVADVDAALDELAERANR